MKQETPQLLTVRETAELLRQSEWSVRSKVRSGEIPALRVGLGPRAPIRIDASELAAWIYGVPPKPSVSGVNEA
jgi:excisionase family DNA binding protein